MFENKDIKECAKILKADLRKGLDAREAYGRLQRGGRNEMREPRKKTVLENFFGQLNDPLIYVLLVAAVVSVLLHEVSDAVIIGVVVLMNALVGLLQEGKARRALESLKKLTSPKAFVIREGRRMEIPAAELVCGDLVYLEAGCQVPADLRLVNASNLKIEESALTGESLPMEKDAQFVGPKEKELALGDRRNMAYMSTIVTYGHGEGLVTATGMHTELGKIATMITESKEEMTPLQKRLGELGKILSILSLALCAALFAIAVWQRRDIGEMLITAISLAVAAVPEGLPAVVTICLALSVTRMVRVNTIVRKLPSVETLGAVSVVCSDKTGTLTQNRMTVEKCYIRGKLSELDSCRVSDCRDFFQGMVLCNDAVAEVDCRIGDPTELALLDAAAAMGMKKRDLEATMPRTGELSFDSDRKMMTTVHTCKKSFPAGNKKGSTTGVSTVSYTKGAPDEVLKHCTMLYTESGEVRMTEFHRNQIRKAIKEMSGQALRTLAVAMKTGENAISEEGLVFLGIVGMKDPARPEATLAVEDFKAAGVKTVMITGDHIDTAFAIAKQLGIASQISQCMSGEELAKISEEELERKLEYVRVFARVSPAQKVRIVDGFKARGEIVAMTGDGVNDAPSLKKADIGIAMGKSGTDVARQASDMILTDDNFSTIRKAIEEGRGVYENIKKSVIFLLSSNMGEIITMFLAVIAGMAAPLKSSHILWINLITDSLPALALGMDKNDGNSLMKQQPRKAKESLFAGGGLVCTLFYGVLIAAVSLSAFLMLPCALLHIYELPVSLNNMIRVLTDETVLAKSQTYAFTVLGMSQLFHAVGMRDVRRSVFRMNHLENGLMFVACAVGFVLQVAVTEIPFLVQAFGTAALSGGEWLRLTGLAAMPLVAHEVLVLLRKKP